MANKLTSEKLKELIKEVLKEEKQQLDEFSINIPSYIGDIRKDFGFDNKTNLSSGTSYQKQKGDIQSLGALDKNNADVTDTDLETAFKNNSGSEFNVADWLMKNSTVKNVQNAAQTAYNKVKGSPPPPHSVRWRHDTNLFPDPNKVSLTKKGKPNASDLATIIKTAAANSPDQTVIDAYTNFVTSEFGTSAGKTIQKALAKFGKIPPSGSGSAQYDQALEDLDKALSVLDVEDMPISRPTIYSQPASSGEFGTEIISSFNTVFNLKPAADTLKKRIERISEISVAMTQESSLAIDKISFITGISDQNEKKRMILSCMMVLDYIAAFAKYFDHGSGAYLFEAFCAMITGGEVTGKDMDSGDFTIETPSGELKGSSKYIQYGKSSKQALSGFVDNSTTTYIFAGKSETVTSKAATSDPGKLVSLSIYLGDVKVSNNKKTVTSGPGDLDFKIKGKKIEIKPGKKPTAELLLAKDKNTSFRESLENTMQKQSNDTIDAYEKFKEFMKASLVVDNITKKYIDSGNKTDGDAALKATEDLDQMQVNLINDIKGTAQNTVKTIGAGTRTLEENKKSQTKSIKDLDKLIERVILESMNKK